jgi:hypothetical protein
MSYPTKQQLRRRLDNERVRCRTLQEDNLRLFRRNEQAKQLVRLTLRDHYEHGCVCPKCEAVRGFVDCLPVVEQRELFRGIA